MKLATVLFAAAFALPSSLALAQSAPNTVAAATEVQDLIAKAKAMPPRPLINQPIVGTGPYRANLEYRKGDAAPASIHDDEHELMYFIEGTGTLTTGASLVDGKRTNPSNQSGSAVANGVATKVSPGLVTIVPAGIAHQIAPDAGSAIAVMTMHVPARWEGK